MSPLRWPGEKEGRQRPLLKIHNSDHIILLVCLPHIQTGGCIQDHWLLIS